MRRFEQGHFQVTDGLRCPPVSLPYMCQQRCLLLHLLAATLGVCWLQVFLLSKAGTHGINLVSCRRICVLEEDWNPVYNLQASRCCSEEGPQARPCA